MFKLLSKESNIFSIPVYIGVLLMFVILFNIPNFNTQEAFINAIALVGLALGYFCIHPIGLSYQTHLPLFLYTILIFGIFPDEIDLGIAVALLTNSFILLILTNPDEEIRKKSYVLIGAIVALNYIFLPTTWPTAIFVLIHILATSHRIALNFIRFFLGCILVVSSYFSIMYFLGYTSWNSDYFPFGYMSVVYNYNNLYPLIPVVLLLIYSILDHFNNFNKKSPVSKFKYTFLLVFTCAQLITIIMYMNMRYEYLLLLTLPLSIILSRMIMFLNKSWKREVALLTIIISMIIFKLNTFTIF